MLVFVFCLCLLQTRWHNSLDEESDPQAEGRGHMSWSLGKRGFRFCFK